MLAPNRTFYELLKWIAFVTMVIDHGNKANLWHSSETMLAIGRAALPIFAFVFAFGVNATKHISKVFDWKTLLAYACLAQPVFCYSFDLSIWSLNMLYVFLVGWLAWRCFRTERLLLHIVGLSSLLCSWPFFSEYSYGITGSLMVLAALFFFDVSNKFKAIPAICFLYLFLSTLPVHFIISTVLFILISTAFCASISTVISIDKTQFAKLYFLHLCLIVVAKTFL